MRNIKRFLAVLLSVTMLISTMTVFVHAEDGDYSISNGYMTYTFNNKTGGFSIETVQGHPKKVLDDNIPLLYKEDSTRSNGTSFVSVRIDDKDYIFGQDYGFFGIDTELKTPVVSNEGKLITIEWTIKGITVIKKVALSTDINTDITGNAGISFEVINNSGKEANVGVRLLLDTALGTEMDAPYVIGDTALFPTTVETEFTGEDVPSQIRNVDSLTTPKRLSYLITKGWEGGLEPNKIIVGHWANIANTRYDYTADSYCDFTNYSNAHKTPDAAIAIYWDNQILAPGESFNGQTLYGVGNFTETETEDKIGINITTERVELNADGDGYKNDGLIEVTIDIDNSLDDSVNLAAVIVNVGVNDEDFEIIGESQFVYVTLMAGGVVTEKITLKAKPQEEITAGEIYVSLSGSEILASGDLKDIETLAERAVILPSTSGKKASIQMAQVNPEAVYYLGEKAVTVTGSMKEFSALKSNQGWELKLIHTENGEEVLIPKKNISFLDDEYTAMSFTTNADLSLGYYDIVFQFSDDLLVGAFGKSVKASVQLESSADEIYRLKTYGLISLVRTTQNNNTDYDFYSFANEKQYWDFYDGKASVTGLVNGKSVKHDFGGDKEAAEEHEILINVKGNIREMERNNGTKYWQADTKDGPVVINNILLYEGEEPLEIYEDKGQYVIEGNGLLKVTNSINVWRSGWQFSVRDDIIYTLNEERVMDLVGKKNPITLEFLGAASMIQGIGGFLVDLKFGELSAQWYDQSDGRITYGIGFGGTIGLPIDNPTGQDEVSPEQAISVVEDQEDISDAMQNLFDEGDDDDKPGSGDDDDDSGSESGSEDGSDTDDGDDDDDPNQGGDDDDNPGQGGDDDDDPNQGGDDDDNPGQGGDDDDDPNQGGDDDDNPGQGGDDDDNPGQGGDDDDNPSQGGDDDDNKPGQGGDDDGNKPGDGDDDGNKRPVSDTSGTMDTTDTTTTTDGDGGPKRQGTGLTDAALSADIRNILFGESGGTNDKGEVEVEKVGFVGIDTTVKVGLPKDVLGSLVNNAPGIMCEMTINTIENIYELNAGLHLKLIECQGILGFKETKIKGQDKVIPNRIEFYIRDGLAIPIAPPPAAVFITGLGGGIDNLADTVSGNFSKLPPITIALYIRLELINILAGSLDARVSLEGLQLKGLITIDELEWLLSIEAQISARWAEPWHLSASGQVDVIDGLIKGQISITIADDYFYGYVCANLCVPDSVPLVGGMQLGGFEAAVSDEFIGGNIKIIGIKFGVIYYWGGDVSFAKGLDLAPPVLMSEIPAEDGNSVTGYYGTNIRPVKSKLVKAVGDASLMAENEILAEITDIAGEEAILLEFPFDGAFPEAGEIILVTPSGTEIPMEYDDGNGGGNFLIQDRREYGKYIYITVTDPALIEEGTWSLRISNDNVTVKDIAVSAVTGISELESAQISYNAANPYNLDVSWTVTEESTSKGDINVYFTKDKNLLTKLKNEEDVSLGDNMGQLLNAEVKNGSLNVTIPDSYESGKYYAVVMLSQKDGVSTVMADTEIDFVNPNLPKGVESVKAIYAGNGNLYIDITDAENPDYTDYVVEIVAEDGTVLSNNLNQYDIDDDFITIGKEANLVPGKNYRVDVKTLREETELVAGSDEKPVTKFYYGTEIVSSGYITMPEISKPQLLSVTTNIDPDAEYIDTDYVTVEYTFDRPVFVEQTFRGQVNYSDEVFKENWKFELSDLEDGDYIVDFTAFSLSKDSVTGADFPDVSGAQLGFNVDTSAPVLTLGKATYENLDDATLTAIAQNTVIADENGAYTITGLTEVDAVITIDGISDRIEVSEDGAFTYNGVLPEGIASTVHTIVARDKAGNESSLTITVIDGKTTAFGSVILTLNGEELQKNEYGEYVLSAVNGDVINLKAMGVTIDNEKVDITDSVDWSILYDKNIVTVNGGKVKTVTYGETAVKAKYNTSSYETTDGRTISAGLETYVVIDIAANEKKDLKTYIEAAQQVLDNNPEAEKDIKDALSEIIDDAQAVYDNENATQAQITDAVTAVRDAIESFNLAIKSDLANAITAAEKLLANNPGAKASAKTAYKAAIDDAKSVLDKADVTVKELNDAEKALATATTTFRNSLGSGGGGNGGSAAGETVPYNPPSGKFQYSIAVTYGEGGSAMASHNNVIGGTSVTITSVPNDGYEVADITVNGKSVGAATIYTIASVNESMAVHVTFRKNTIAAWNPFDDIASDAWYHDTVRTVYEKGLMNGMAANKFEPEGSVTRAMFVTVLYRMEGSPETAGNTKFVDVEAGSWYDNAVAWASANGIVLGISDTHFDPYASITREQMAAMIYRYMKYKGMGYTTAPENNLTFADTAEISDYAVESVIWCVESGIINGMGNNMLSPKGTSTRAQAATVLARISDTAK